MLLMKNIMLLKLKLLLLPKNLKEEKIIKIEGFIRGCTLRIRIYIGLWIRRYNTYSVLDIYHCRKKFMVGFCEVKLD